MPVMVKLLGLGALAVLLLAVLALWAFQRFDIYRFTDTPAPSPPPGVERVTVQAPDGMQIPVWLARSADPEAPWIFSFYGNAATLEGSFAQISGVTGAGYNLAMMHYRGTQSLPGRPSEMGFAGDALALYDQFDDLVGGEVRSQARILHGFSLGAGVGSRLAATRPFAGVILQSAPYRTCQFFERRYRGVPLCQLMWRERYDIVDHLRGIEAPVLIIHGRGDASVPLSEAEANFAAAPNPWGLRVLDGGHSNLAGHGLVAEITGFVADVTDRP